MTVQQLAANGLPDRILRVLGALFRLTIEVSDEPAGKRIGRLNLPGALHHFLNIELRIIGIRALAGYIELV